MKLTQYDKTYTIPEYINTVISTIKTEQSCDTKFPLPYKEVLEKDKIDNYQNTDKCYHPDLL